jgi:uncharacterized damage-inducible protein DinB
MSVDFERTEPPTRGSERDLLCGFLDFQRQTLEWKCSGLTPEQLKAATVPPSPLTLLGLLRHMAGAEQYWFQTVLLGRTAPDVYEVEDAWGDLDSQSVEEVVRRWKEACETSRRNVAAVPTLDHEGTRPRYWDGEIERDGDVVSLRMILIHMIEEYARHNGHADFLRERIDGATGE